LQDLGVEVGPECAVVDAALVRRAQQRGVLAAGGEERAGQSGDGLGNGRGVQARLGEAAGDVAEGGLGEGGEQRLASGEVPVERGPADARRAGDLGRARPLSALGQHGGRRRASR
jgi:hypothetical protein